ncbi:hypothetical protein N7528_008311 [Penicillium herquei]|nr:hypothetical protein N7528_008311 [Penicillium herquei]
MKTEKLFKKQLLELPSITREHEDAREDEDEFDDLDEDQRIDLELQQYPEDHEYLIRGDAAQLVKIRLFLIDSYPTHRDFGATRTWVRNFVAECTCNGVVVATALARYIRRRRIRHGFWERMQKQSEGMRRFAFEVFDHRGALMMKYKNHPVQKGTGVWRSELDQGPLVFFEKLHIIAPGLRRKGLGQKVVSLLLEKIKKFSRARKRSWEYFKVDGKVLEPWTLHALVIPGYLKSEAASDFVDKSPEERLVIKNQAEAVALEFWRSCGFRRIGASECFAFSFNLEHPSHALAAASDFNHAVVMLKILKIKSSELSMWLIALLTLTH